MVKTSILAVILGVMVLSVVVFADEADGAGLVWRAVSKVGSLISDLADVGGGCANNDIYKYQTSNSTWICGTDNTGSGFTTISSMISPNGNATILAENSTSKAVFKTISVGTGLSILNGSNSVVLTNTVTDTDTGFTNLASTGTTNATVIATNGTSLTRATFKTISAGTGIQVDNGTDSVIIQSTITQGFTNIANSNTGNLTSLIVSNSSNRAVFKTLSPGDGITLTNDANNIVISSIETVSTIAPTNATLIADNSTVTNKVILKTISNGTGLEIFNGTNTISIAEAIKPYAQISDTTNQTCAFQVIKNVTLNTNNDVFGITHSTSSNQQDIVIDSPGLYHFLAGAQVGRTSATGVDTHNLWMIKNNVKIANTNERTYMTAVLNDTSVVFMNWSGVLAQNDVIGYQQNCYQTAVVGLRANAIGIPPATPSISVTVVKLQ